MVKKIGLLNHVVRDSILVSYVWEKSSSNKRIHLICSINFPTKTNIC